MLFYGYKHPPVFPKLLRLETMAHCFQEKSSYWAYFTFAKTSYTWSSAG